MRYRNAISYAILLVIAYDIKDIANAIKKISHEISLRYRNDAISHAISHLTRIQMEVDHEPSCDTKPGEGDMQIVVCQSMGLVMAQNNQ